MKVKKKAKPKVKADAGSPLIEVGYACRCSDAGDWLELWRREDYER